MNMIKVSSNNKIIRSFILKLKYIDTLIQHLLKRILLLKSYYPSQYMTNRNNGIHRVGSLIS